MFVVLLVALLLATAVPTASLHAQPPGVSLRRAPSPRASERAHTSRRSVLDTTVYAAALGGAAALCFAPSANAEGYNVAPSEYKGSAAKGKDYNVCISDCIYEATKITKGVAQVEVVTREEAMVDCKAKCRPLKVKK